MSDDRSDKEESPEDFPGLDELVGGFMQEASLWPVLIVVIGSAGTFGAAMLILTGVDHNPFAAAALVLIFGMSVDVFFQARRKALYRNLAKLIGLIWLAAVMLAGLAVWTGIAF
jgi:hypothetical protein